MQNLLNNIEFLIAQDILKGSSPHHKMNPREMSLADLDTLSKASGYTLEQLFFMNLTATIGKHKDIKLLILDVDGVMTDGGMYYSESGRQMKKFNTKDGMAILHLIKKGVLVGIISSGFKNEIVKARAETLKIPLVYVGRAPKIVILKDWCEKYNIDLANVAMIGDDVNDLSIIQQVGLSACPSDAVQVVKQNSDILLQHKGGEGCVREFIENYLLDEAVAY